MAIVYQSICAEADSLLVKATNLIEKQIRYKLQIEKLMNKGFVHIAKARYIMGSTCVTKMQLPTENSNPIQPVATVCRAEKNNSWVFHIHRKDESQKSNKINDLNEEVGEDEEIEEVGENEHFINLEKKHSSNSEVAFKNMLENNPKGLKKSKQAFHVDDKLYHDYNEELLDEMSNDSDSNASLNSVTDPIRLFGVLVPNTLKEGQTVFKDVVKLVGNCATIQSELQNTLQKYNHLVKVKKLIEEAAIEKLAKIEITKPKVYWTPSETSSITCHSTIEQDENEEGEDKESDKEIKINVKKSIRSVFYDLRDVEPQEAQSLWSSVNRDSDAEENEKDLE